MSETTFPILVDLTFRGGGGKHLGRHQFPATARVIGELADHAGTSITVPLDVVRGTERTPFEVTVVVPSEPPPEGEPVRVKATVSMPPSRTIGHSDGRSVPEWDRVTADAAAIAVVEPPT